MPLDVEQRFRDIFGGGYGLWYGAADSQKIVEGDLSLLDQTDTTLDPNPTVHIVKFGGDWGGMWGTEETRAAPFKHLANGEVVPYLYVVPDWWVRVPNLVGELFRMGYRAVLLDVEQEWFGQEHLLVNLLDVIDTDQNCVGVSGYAFGFAGANPTAFAEAVTSHNVVYFPQAYLGEYTDHPGYDTALAATQAQLESLGLDKRMSVILDKPSLSDPDAVAWLHTGIGGSVWHNEDVPPEGWAALTAAQNPLVTPVPSTPEPTATVETTSEATPTVDVTPAPDAQPADATPTPTPEATSSPAEPTVSIVLPVSLAHALMQAIADGAQKLTP